MVDNLNIPDSPINGPQLIDKDDTSYLEIIRDLYFKRIASLMVGCWTNDGKLGWIIDDFG